MNSNINKILTVIVPTYNMEALLYKDLRSLITKTHLDKLEIIVVNDGSKDKSSEIAHEFEANYPETFYVIDKENGNYGSCINAALKKATGKYIRILDADDSVFTENFEEFLSVLSKTDVDLFFSDYQKYYGKNDTETISFSIPSGIILNAPDFFNSDAFASIQMPAITYRTEILHKIGYHQTEGISYTDMEWCFSPMSKVVTFFYFNKPVYRYLLSREGQTMDPAVQIRRFDQVLKSMTTILDTYSRIRRNAVSNEYLVSQILRHLLYIYRFYLVDNKTVSRTVLRKFDSEVSRLAPEAYSRSGAFEYRPKISYRYVENWRNGKHEFIPKNILLKEQVLDTLGKIHLKLNNLIKGKVK